MKKAILFTFLAMLTIASFNSCTKDPITPTKKDPVITWTNPVDITNGTLLSATQLNATADVPGTFVYTPALGTNLSEGANQNLKVDFTPSDATSYNTASKTVSINVTKNELLGIAKIKTVTYTTTEYVGYEVDTYQYDTQGRVTRVDFTDGVENDFETFEYPNSTTVIEKWGSDAYTYTLNATGQAIQYVESGSSTNTYYYTYDSDGFMSNGNFRVVVNGNIVSDGGTTYEYDLTKINTIGDKNMGLGFYGNDDKNLITKETNGAYIVTYTYEFDAKGRVSKQTADYSGLNTDYLVFTYTD